MPETTALGAAMAAGAAEGVGVWSLEPEDLSAVTMERFEPQINAEGMFKKWKRRSARLAQPVEKHAPLDLAVIGLNSMLGGEMT